MNNNTKRYLKQLRKTNPDFLQGKPRLSNAPKVAKSAPKFSRNGPKYSEE